MAVDSWLHFHGLGHEDYVTMLKFQQELERDANEARNA